MGAKPTKSAITENLNSIVSQSYRTFTVLCQRILQNGQEVSVRAKRVTWTTPTGTTAFQTNKGCLACQKSIVPLIAQYQLASFSYPGTPPGSAQKIEEYQFGMCAIVCSDVFVTGINQDSTIRFEGTCSVTDETHSEFTQQVTANIMQSLESNGDAFSAIADSLRGGTDLEVRNKIQAKMEQNLTVDITNQMNAAIVANQAFIVSESNSVYSAGISQQLILDVCVTVLVKNDFANKVFADTDIDIYTEVKNDQNTVQAALDAIERVNDAFNRALTTNASLFGAFIALLAIGGAVLLLCIVLQVMADNMKRQRDEYCDVEHKSTTLAVSGTVGGQKVNVKVPLLGI